MSKLSEFWFRFRKKVGNPKLLCDTCKFDYLSACHHAERPNATSCRDYQRK